jgi:hypothetical protein
MLGGIGPVRARLPIRRSFDCGRLRGFLRGLSFLMISGLIIVLPNLRRLLVPRRPIATSPIDP